MVVGGANGLGWEMTVNMGGHSICSSEVERSCFEFECMIKCENCEIYILINI